MSRACDAWPTRSYEVDPIVTAPVWLVTSDPVTAFRLTQGIHAVLFSLAAIPAYLLCRRLGLDRWLGIAVAEGVGAPYAPAELTWALILAAARRLTSDSSLSSR